MLEFFTLPNNIIFSVSLTIVLMISVLEGFGLILGVGVIGILDSILPGGLDFELDGPDIDSPNSLGRLLSWLRYKKVPVMITLIVFLTAFGLLGLIIQGLVYNLLGFALSGLLIGPVTAFLALPGTRLINSILAKAIPSDETAAVSLESLVGRVATITLGNAKRNSPAQGKVKDQNGKTHYLMIEPDDTEDVLEHGEDVLLVRKDSSKFYAIKNTNKVLSNS